jgi:hypothetical protein
LPHDLTFDVQLIFTRAKTGSRNSAIQGRASAMFFMALKIVATNPIFAGHEEVSDGLSGTGDVLANRAVPPRPDKSEILAVAAACRN